MRDVTGRLAIGARPESAGADSGRAKTPKGVRFAAAVLVVLAGAVVIGALAVFFATWDRGGEGAQPAVQDPSGIEAQATLTPRTVLFGDTVRGDVHVAVDSTRIDPDSVRVAADFSPWEVVGRPERIRRDAGDTAHVRTTFVLRCLTGGCELSGPSAPLQLEPARIAYSPRSGQDEDASSVQAQWPVLLVYSRFAAVNYDAPGDQSSAWRADLTSLPAVTYRLAPGVLVALLLGGAALAALAAVGLAYVAWPRRAPPEPEPEPELPPEPVLSPLEQALALLEESVRSDGAAEQRRALELVAEELELAEWGDRDLARTARALAWSEGVPPVDQTNRLAARVRSALPEIAAADAADDNGGSRVVV